MSRTAHKLLSASGGKAYEIEQSLMFNREDTPYLERIPSSAGNRRTWTFSAWVKRNKTGIAHSIFTAHDNLTENNSAWNSNGINSDDKLQVGGWSVNYRVTNRLFRDVSAWYHIVISLDTTNATAGNRVKVYINGVEETSFATTDNPDQNEELGINSTIEHQIGASNYTNRHSFDGYIAEAYFIDGTVKAASDFGETDAVTGQWIPKKYTGGSYGTNGYYIPFKKNDRYSVYFDDTSNTGISIADSSDWDFGTNDFTVECWIYRNEDAGDQSYIFGQADNTNGSNAGNSVYISVYDQHLSGIAVDASNTNNYVYLYSTADSTTIEDNKWYHVAMVRSGNDWNLYLNGTSIDSETTSITVNSCSSIFGVGKQGVYNDGFWKGWISNFRLVMGTAVYTSNFTPPTSPLTAITNTKLLCCQDADATVDNSGTSKTLTVTAANTYTQQLSPFDYDWYDDHSGQDNHYQADNITINDVMLDSPTNNYPTVNSVEPYNSTVSTLAEGNLNIKAAAYSSGNYGNHFMTFKVPESGKWYVEMLAGVQAGSGNRAQLVVNEGHIIPSQSSNIASNANSTGIDITLYGNTLDMYDGGSTVGTQVTGLTATSYVCALAIDVDNNKVYGGYDSGSGITWLNSGDPAGNSNGTAHTFTSDSKIGAATAVSSDNAQRSYIIMNFGQNGTFSSYKTAGGNTDGNGEGNFFYSPPSGFKALCSKNLPDPAIKKPTEHFNTILYTGNETARSITGVGFEPSWVWIKERSAGGSHRIFDQVRGVNKVLQSDQNREELDRTEVTAFNSDGFSLADSVTVNQDGVTHVAWNWKANGSGSTNNDGAEASTVSVNTTAGFSIIKGEGTGSSTTYGHGLGVVPKVYIVKLISDTGDWYLQTSALDGGWDYIQLNATAASASMSATAPTSSVITSNATNGEDFIIYAFSEVEGFSKFSSYTGNASTDGPYIYTGFRPAYVLIKNAVSGKGWTIFDNKRDVDNPTATEIYAHASDAEASGTNLDILSNGFKIRATNTWVNGSTNTLLFMSFAESPFKYANAR